MRRIKICRQEIDDFFKATERAVFAKALQEKGGNLAPNIAEQRKLPTIRFHDMNGAANGIRHAAHHIVADPEKNKRQPIN